jgi:hypothetical protein
VDHVSDRRGSLRITEVRDIFGALLPIGEPLVLEDLSHGGFAVTSPFDFLSGTEHTFAFCMPGGHHICLNAVTVHSERCAVDEAIYRVGFSFVTARSNDDLAIAVLADVAKTLRPSPTRRRR